MSQRPPVDPFEAKYRDPVTVALLLLPFVSYDRRQALIGKREDVKPASQVYQALEWYTRHDLNLLLVPCLTVATSPIILTPHGVQIEWIVSAVVVSMFLLTLLCRNVERRSRGPVNAFFPRSGFSR